MLTNLTLSQAIREGAKLRPQGFANYFVNTNQGVCSCALGAAFETLVDIAVFNFAKIETANFLESRFPQLQSLVYLKDCPPVITEFDFGNRKVKALGAVITQLNDSHKWTREQIADWVEIIEKENIQFSKTPD